MDKKHWFLILNKSFVYWKLLKKKDKILYKSKKMSYNYLYPNNFLFLGIKIFGEIKILKKNRSGDNYERKNISNWRWS